MDGYVVIKTGHFERGECRRLTQGPTSLVMHS
jgi:hypothetical protein